MENMLSKFNAEIVRERTLHKREEAAQEEKTKVQNAILTSAEKGKFVVECSMEFPTTRQWLEQLGFKIVHAQGEWDTGNAAENDWLISWYVKDQNFIFMRQKGSSKL